MAAALQSDRLNVGNSSDAKEHAARRFRDDPTSLFVDAIADHIKRTGEPETAPGTYKGAIDRGARYRILRPVDIDRRKRPQGDMAPCPMCTSNRFLRGVIAYFMDLGFVAVIGHCCAEHAEDAERTFKTEELKRRQEDFLLLALPALGAKRESLGRLRGLASEAQSVYRKFRKAAPGLHQHLREVAGHHRGRLVLYEILSTADEEIPTEDYVGPAGFRGRGRLSTETRDHDFGILDGLVATLRDYAPQRELDDAIRTADSFDFAGGEAEAIEFIAALDDDPVRRRAAVATCQGLDMYYARFQERLTDFRAFWAPENIERLRRYGNSEFSNFAFDLRRVNMRGLNVVLVREAQREARIVLSPTFTNTSFPEWSYFKFKAP